MERNDSHYEFNAYNIRFKKGCASCALKGYQNNGKRICTRDHIGVKASHCCDQWQMSEGLSACGRHCGVVRDKDTKEVVIH